MREVMLKKKWKGFMYIFVLLMAIYSISPGMASGEVAQITETRDKLAGISQEEQKVLNQLFLITQNIEAIGREVDQITADINSNKEQIINLEYEINSLQRAYDSQLNLMEQVLVSYQRGGPATYLEILLNSKSLASFLKSINLLQNITHNVNDLLLSIEEGQVKLQGERDNLASKIQDLELKEEELAKVLDKEQQLKNELEATLIDLQVNRAHYEGQLQQLENSWEEIKGLFPRIIEEFTRIIEEGYITTDDIEMKFQFFQITGSLKEEVFNKILERYSTLPKMMFYFHPDRVDIEVPDQKLFLSGNFVLEGDSAIKFEVDSGTFYDMELERASIEELFSGGALIIDFKEIAGDNITIDFKLHEATSNEGYLSFVIRLLF